MKNGATRKDVLAYAKKTYGTVEEYLFADSPMCAVLRREDNGKWYGIVMDVKRSSLFLTNDQTKVDVLNVKVDPAALFDLLGEKGILPAYHMSKSHWISILLDGSVDREFVYALMRMSRRMTAPKSKKSK